MRAGGRFICDLSVCLFHKWVPGANVLILKAYIDESGTHSGSPRTVMAGYYSKAENWQAFEARWQAFCQQRGFKCLHTKELYHGQGEFSGLHCWGERKQIAEEALSIANTYAVGFAAVMKNSDYNDILRDGSLPQRIAVDSRFGACIRAIYGFLIQSSLIEEAEGVEIVFEVGHKNIGAAQALLEDLRKLGDPVFSGSIKSVTFTHKTDVAELQLADLLAYSLFKLLREGDKKPQDAKRLMIEAPHLQPPFIHRIPLSRPFLRDLKSGLLLVAELRKRYGRKWTRALWDGRLDTGGGILLSSNPSVIEKWIERLPETRTAPLPSWLLKELHRRRPS